MSEFKIKVNVELDADDLKSKLEKLGGDNEIELKINTNKIEEQLKGLKKSFKDTFKLDGQVINDLNKIATALKKFDKSLGKPSNTQGRQVNGLVKEYKELGNVVAKLEKQLNNGKLGADSVNRISNAIDELKKKMQTLRTMAEQSMDFNSLIKMDDFDHSQLNKSISEIHSNLNKVETQAESIRKAINNIDMSNISDGSKSELQDILDIIERIKTEAKDVNLDMDTGTALRNLRDCEDAVKRISREARSSSNGGIFGGMIGSWDDFKGSFASLTLANVVGDFLEDTIRETVRAWKDLVVETDSAMTDLRKVYDENLSGDNLSKYLDNVTEVAKNTGKSSVDVIQGTANAVKMGIDDINKALEFSQRASMFSNVGDVSQEQADTMLSAILSAYGGVEESLKPVREQIKGASKDYNNLTKFTDLANHAGNNYAVTTADIGEALQQSASALQTNGVSMEKSVAMVVAMNEVLQNAGKSGNSLKSISAGLSGLTVSAKDGSIQLTKSGMALKEIAKIDVWNKKTGEIKDMYSVMDELADKWDGLSEAEQNALGTAIAGKTQLNAFNALLSNWETARQYVQDYKDGLTVGSAERENEKYLDSIAGKWNRIKENMASIGNTLVTSDMVKGVLSVLDVTTGAMDKVVQKGSSFFSEIMEGNGGKVISDSLFGVFEDVFDNLGDFGGKIASTLSDGIGKAFDIALDMTHIGKAFEPLKGVMDTLDLGFGDKKLNNQIEEREQNVNAINKEIKALSGQKDAIDNILPRYEELSEKTKRTAVENQELAQIREQLASTNSELVLGYNDDGSPILKNLELQSKQLESQIKMKQQSLRLEENLLAIQAKQRQEQQKKDYNKNLKEYGGMELATDTKRKDGLFGGESLKNYAQRIIKENEALSEKNNEIYQKRLQDHQQYIEDERAIQEKYINQMESNTTFKAMSENMKSGLLTFMDSLDWSKFSDAQATSFTNSLSKMGNKFVSTTKDMGEHGKAIDKLVSSYANGEMNLKTFTEGLTEQYKLAGKFDAESFTAWRMGLQSYIDMTGDIGGATKEIDRMATTLNKITGIGKTEWLNALTFDPAPIDASNQALQKFLKSYHTGVQNLGKGGLADTLTDQFANLQSSYMQLTQDLASGQEIDVEYLVNATVGNPECVQNLVQELVADGEVSEQDIELLMRVQGEILNKGQITEETYQQVADILGMDVQDVKIKLNAKAEITGLENLKDQLADWDKLSVEEKKSLFIDIKNQGFEEFQMTQEEWNNLSDTEKQLLLRQLVEGTDYFKEHIKGWDELTEEEKEVVMRLTTQGNEEFQMSVDEWNKLSEEKKEQILNQKTEGSNELKADNEYYQSIKNEEKKQTLNQKTENSEELKTDNEYYKGINNEEKEQTLQQKVVGFDLFSGILEIWNGTPNTEEKVETLRQNTEGTEGIISAKEYWDSLSDEEKNQLLKQGSEGSDELKSNNEYFKGISTEDKQQTLKQKVEGSDSIEKAKDLILKIPTKTDIIVNIVQKGKDLLGSISDWISSLAKKNEQTVTVKAKVGEVDTSSLTKFSAKPIEIKANTSSAMSQVNSLKSTLGSIQAKPINITVNTSSAMSQVNSLKSTLSSIQAKPINITANTSNALGLINTLKATINSIQPKTINVSANVVGLANINALKSTINSLQSKAISIVANVIGTNGITTLKSAINSLQGKTVTVKVISEGATGIAKLISSIAGVNAKQVTVVAKVTGTSQVNALISAINKVKSKSVKISASVSGTSAVNSLASAIANVRSKTVKVNVNRSVTTTTQTVGASVSEASYTPSPTSLLTSDIVSASNGIAPIDVPVTATAKSDISNLSNILPSIDFDVDLFKNLEEALKNLEAQLNVIDGKMEGAFGQEKVKLLQQQIPLLREQQKIQEQIIQDERKVNSETSKWLKNQGFTFNNLGEITNYSDKLLAMEQNVDSLKKKYDALNDVENKNENAVKSAKDAYDKANDTLSKAKDYLNAYFDTNNTSILEATEKWYDYENQIREAQDAVKKLAKELKELDVDSGYKNVERDIADVQNKLDMNDALLDRANGDEAIKLLEEKIKLTQQLQKETQDLINYEKQLRNGLMSELAQYGFSFRDDGSIVGYSQKIEELKKTLSDEEFENVFGKIEEYIEKTTKTIPDLQLEYEKFNNEILDSKENIKDVQDEIAEATKNLSKELKELHEDSAYKDHERDLAEVEALIKINEAKLNKANGQERVDLLKEQISLTKQLQKEKQDMLNFEVSNRNKLMSELGQYGFSFRDDGSMPGYGGIIANLKKTLSEEEFDDVFEKVEKYLETTYETIPNLEAEWIELSDAIVENVDEIEELERQMQLLYNENQVQSLTSQFEQLATELDIISNKIEFAYGTNKIKLMADSIKLMNEQLSLQSDIIHSTKKQSDIYQHDLRNYGFNFDNGGNITNLSEQMAWFNNTDSFEKVNKLVEEYFDIQGELQGVIKDYSDLENAIKDAYKQQLDITKDIEDKITDVIEKEHEKRKKEVEDYTNARIGLLKEEQDAYRKLREEQDYEKTMQNQLDEIDALRKQIEIAKRDTSISGEKRLAELTKELAEAEKELAEVTQEKIDKDYEGNIDSEIEKLEKEQDMLLKSLEEQFSEVNIGKMVASALTTGIIEINGEVQTLQNILINSINDSVEGYSVMSDVIKNELVSNLNVALETMRQIENIGEVLGLQNYNVLNSSAIELTGTPSYNGGGHTVMVGDTHLVINGSVSDDIISDIEELINQKNNEMLNKITSSL